MGEIKKPSCCLPDTPSVMDKSIHLAQEWEKLEGRRTRGQPLPPTSEVSQQVQDHVVSSRRAAASCPPSSPPTRVSFVAHHDWTLTGKGVLEDAVALIKLTDFKATTGDNLP